MRTNPYMKHLSPLAAWALAFGCAVGSDSFVMPWTTFLPNAGPLGTAIGLVVGGIIMAVIAWNYHYMINRRPGPGGSYSYAADTFGYDHGFLCGWFLGLTYLSIIWLDATVLASISHYMFGDFFHFGFQYTVAGFDVYLGEVLLSVTAVAASSAICCRRRLSGCVQTVLAIIFAAGILVCFVAAATGHEYGGKAFLPAFAPDGTPPPSQVIRFVAIATWLFVGFESISHSSAEFRFFRKKAFAVMVAALVSSVVAYMLLSAIPVFMSGDKSWVDAVAKIGADKDMAAFAAAGRPLGKAGVAVMGVTLICAVFTNLVGNTVAASRLIAAMSNDGALPPLLGGKNADGAPRNAVINIVLLSIVIITYGRATIGNIVDLALVGAAIAYAYTSAATFTIARRAGNRLTQATGMFGLAISIAIILVFMLPNFTATTALMATESYLLLVFWCIVGLVLFLVEFRRDRLRRFGRSSIVWVSLVVIVLALSLMWIRQSTYELTEWAYDNIVHSNSDNCLRHFSHRVRRQNDWHATLHKNLSQVSRTITRNNFIQGGLNILVLVLTFTIYAILRRRERDIEREKAKAKSYFFSTVSHDIRTPLNAIIGFSEMLKAGFKTEAERDQAIDSILVSGKTLLGLINDVLDLSKLESGKMVIKPEPTDCELNLQKVMDAFRVTAGRSEFELRSRVDTMPLLMIDAQRLRQVAFNLVGNAVKFTKKGYVELRASFRQTDGSDTGTFRLEVEDTGCGISEEDKKRIGSAYVQVGSVDARNGGTGLGLAICKQLVASVGGRLEIESTLGKGSTFTIVLPDTKVADVDETEMSPSGANEDGAKPVAPDAQPSAQPHVRRILIVDDSKMNIMVLKALLKHLGDFETVSAMNGQEALEILDAPGAEPFDLVLTDMWMPTMDGEGLIRAIRNNPAHSSLRVIVVTADVEFQGKAAAMGFNDILLKPVTTESLRKVVVV